MPQKLLNFLNIAGLIIVLSNWYIDGLKLLPTFNIVLEHLVHDDIQVQFGGLIRASVDAYGFKIHAKLTLTLSTDWNSQSKSDGWNPKSHLNRFIRNAMQTSIFIYLFIIKMRWSIFSTGGSPTLPKTAQHLSLCTLC